MSQRQVLQVFEQYQKSRTQFVQTIAELATRPQNIETLNAGKLGLGSPTTGSVVKGDILPQLVYSLTEQNSRVSVSWRDIAKHSPELAQTVVDTGAIAHLAQMILNPDAKLKRQVFSALSQISKHSVDLAEMVVEAEIFPAVLACLRDPDEYVRKNVTTLMREITKHTPELSLMIVNAGGVAAVIDYLGDSRGNVRLPGIMMLGYVAAHSENLAMAVIVSKVCDFFLNMFEKQFSSVQFISARLDLISVFNLCQRLQGWFPSPECLVQTAQGFKIQCIVFLVSSPLPFSSPLQVLPHDSKARRLFVTSGGLKKVQEIKADPGSALQEYINSINNCYPEEIVRYYSPGYSETLLARVEKYQPV
eukprot:XP_014012616.1 PREDICTED: sperm-associated antigen 6-like [Salmo salar]